MNLNVLFAAIAYFIIGFIFFLFFEPGKAKENINYFLITYLFSLYFCLLFYFAWITLGLEDHKGIQGLFSSDGSTYFLNALRIVDQSFSRDILDLIITDHYHDLFLAFQIYVFGSHVLIPKIYQVLLFSIGVIFWVSIASDILQNPRITKHFFYLLLFCFPLLSYVAETTKEIMIFFSTTLTFYGFAKYHYSQHKKFKFLLFSLAGIFLLFLFRRQFALILSFSLIISSIVGTGISFNKKILWIGLSAIMFFLVSNLPFFQEIGAVSPLTEGGSIFIARGETARVPLSQLGESRGIVGGVRFLATSPLIAFPMLVYGIFMIFFHPPFLYTPAEMIARGQLFYLIHGYYNAFFAILLPAFLFGIRHLYKRQYLNPVLIAIFVYFILANLGTIFGSDSYRRFKVSYFWPIAYLYICTGISTFPLWKKYLPLVGIILLVLFIMYFTIDLIGWVSV